MFEKIKSLSKQSLIYGLGYVLSRFLPFLLLPFYSHFMPPGDYGALNFIYMYIAVMQVLYIGGLDIAFLRHYVGEEKEIQKQIFSTSFLTMGGGCLFLTGIFYIFPSMVSDILFKEKLADADKWVRIAAGVLLVDTISTVPLFRLRGDQRPLYFSVVKVTNSLLNVGANILLVGMWKLGPAGALYANLFSSAVQFLMLLPVVWDILKMELKWATLKELWKFGLPNVPAMLLLYVIEFSGRKILELETGLREAGLYSAGYKMGMFMAIVTNAYRFAWQPFFLAEAKNKDAEQTFARIFTYFFAAASLLFLIFVMFAGDLIMSRLPIVNIYILDKEYWPGMAVFPLILLAHFFDGLYANFSVGVYLKKKTKLIPLIMGITAGYNIIANIIVIPRFGMMGAAWVALTSFMLMAAAQYKLIHKHYPVPYEWGRVVKLAVSAGIAAGAYFMYPGPIWWRIILLSILPGMLWALKFFTESEKQRIRKVIGHSALGIGKSDI